MRSRALVALLLEPRPGIFVAPARPPVLASRLAWRRERGALIVDQHRGVAAWRVADDTLRIDAGAGVASVEATGASLRVEVHMQLSDARVIGASAVTAAAVAFVTVVVYEGHVKVTASGQTVNVEPGATVDVRPGQPPGPPPVVGTDDEVKRLQQQVEELQHKLDSQPDQNVVGGPPVLDQRVLMDGMRPKVAACVEKQHGRGNFHLRFRTRGDGSADLASFQLTMDNASTSGDLDVLATCLKDILVHTAFPKSASEYDMGFPIAPLPADSLDRDAITAAMNSVRAEVMRCGDQHPAKGVVKVRVHVQPDGVADEVTDETTPDEDLGMCVAGAVNQARYPQTKNGGSFNYPFKFDGKPPCDADALDEKARMDEAVGQHAAALANFEAAIKCKPTDRLYSLAFMAACNAANLSKARYYYAKVPAGSRKNLEQMCVRNGIKVADLMYGQDFSAAVEIRSTPRARILIDGADTNKRTPARITMPPGKHKVTFVIGDDRYTFPVNAVAGQTVVLDKDLH